MDGHRLEALTEARDVLANLADYLDRVDALNRPGPGDRPAPAEIPAKIRALAAEIAAHCWAAAEHHGR